MGAAAWKRSGRHDVFPYLVKALRFTLRHLKSAYRQQAIFTQIDLACCSFSTLLAGSRNYKRLAARDPYGAEINELHITLHSSE